MRHFDELDKRLDYIEFRQELLFENTDLTRLLFEYEIDRKQYKKIMDLMEAYRKKLDNKESVIMAHLRRRCSELFLSVMKITTCVNILLERLWMNTVGKKFFRLCMEICQNINF